MLRDALVVGINAYRYDGLQPLRSPAADAEAIAQALETHGEFRVWRLPEVINPFEGNTRRVARRQEVTLETLEASLVQLFKPEGQHFPDTALFFFSGHGLRKQRGIQEGYLATSDANPEQGNWGLSLQWLRRLLQESPVRQQVVWIDCCYSGELLNFVEADPGDLGRDRDRCFIAASREYEVAYEETTGRHSVLTQALLSGLDPQQQLDSEVSNFTLIDALNRGFKNATQRPVYANSGGKIVLTGRATQAFGELPDSVCPYKGLSYFDYAGDDPKYFYGRTALTDQLIDAVRQGNFLAVLGASGSGKSSVVRAGLLHQLKLGQRLSGSDRWPLYVLRPGEHPLRSLAWAFVDEGASEVERASQLAKATDLVESGGVGLGHLVTAVAGEGRAVVVIDQFEEAFTLCSSEAERRQFFACLMGVLAQVGQKICLVVAMRADFFGKCAEQEYAGLAQALQAHLVTVSPMTPKELEQAITEPAKRAGLEVERELVAQILADVEGPGSLPLLQYTLTELWRRRTVNRLSLTEYTRLGGVKGTLRSRAEAVYQALSGEEQRIAQHIFLELTQLGEGTEDTRRRVFQKSLITVEGHEAQVARVIQRLADAKLVVTSELAEKSAGPGRVAVVDVAHEALIRHWPRLRAWIEENRARLRVQRQIEEAAKLWQQHDRQTDFLLQGVRLAEAEDIYERYREGLSSEIKMFIEASLALQQQRLQRERRRLRRAQIAAWAIALLGVSVSGLGGAAYWQGRLARLKEVETLNALSQAKLATHEDLEALVASVQAGRQVQQLSHFGVPKALERDTAQALLRVMNDIQEQNQLEGHADGVTDVAFSPNGQLLASASTDGTIKLWGADGTPLASWEGHGGEVFVSVRFSPDGQAIASSSSDRTVRLWNLQGEELAVLEGHSGTVIDVAFSSDGSQIASTSEDGTVKLWNTSGNELLTLADHDAPATSVSFSPTGQMLASAGYDNTVRLWSAEGEPLNVLVGHQAPIISVRFSHDGQAIASASTDGDVRLWRSDGQPLRVLSHSSGVNEVSFSADGQHIAAAGEDRTVSIWRLDGERLWVLKGHDAPVNSVSFSPSGTLATASADWEIKLWTLDKPKLFDLQRTLNMPEEAILSVDFSSEGQMLASAGGSGVIRLQQLHTDEVRTLEGHQASINRVRFSPDGSRLISSSQDGTVRVWSTQGQPLQTLRAADIVNDISFSPDGQTMALASDDNTVRLWGLGSEAGNEIRVLRGHDGPVYGVSFHPRENILASVGEDKTVRLWNLEGELLKTLTGHSARVWRVSFSPDGQTLASVSDDHTVRLWSLDGQPLGILEGHGAAVFDASFSPDGQRLASASHDHTIKIWDLLIGQAIQTLQSHSDGISDIAFDSQSRTLASAGLDSTVKLWGYADSATASVDLEELLGYGCGWLQGYLNQNVNINSRDRGLCET